MSAPVKDPRSEFWLILEAGRKLREETKAERERATKLRLDIRTLVAIARARRAAHAVEPATDKPGDLAPPPS